MSDPTFNPDNDPILGHATLNLFQSAELMTNDLVFAADFLRHLRWAISYATPPDHALFPNVVAAHACFIRCHQGIQAAISLTLQGFYTEARTIIRSVYEAAGLARMLAHDTELADKWLHKNEWVPDRKSRAFIASFTGDTTGAAEYREWYARASSMAHPTALSTLPYLLDATGKPTPKLDPEVSPTTCASVFREIMIETAFVCFAFRNALVHENALPVEWYQRVAELARQATGAPLEHLNRDWATMEHQQQALRDAVLSDAQLSDHLRDDPNSWHNAVARSQGPD